MCTLICDQILQLFVSKICFFEYYWVLLHIEGMYITYTISFCILRNPRMNYNLNVVSRCSLYKYVLIYFYFIWKPEKQTKKDHSIDSLFLHMPQKLQVRKGSDGIQDPRIQPRLGDLNLNHHLLSPRQGAHTQEAGIWSRAGAITQAFRYGMWTQ